MNAYRHQRFPRTAGEAFRTPQWSAAIERPYPSFWKRIAIAIKECLQ
jgi:hypothetical protein